MRRLLLSLVLLIAALGCCADAHAQSELAPGELRMSITEGYGGYALPVANAALGRNWAAESGLEWQVAYNYSVIPLRLDILHRFPFAFRGRIEITTAHGYAREEDPLGHFAITTREILIPPSVPTSVMLAPRVSPPSQPGSLTHLLVKVYQAEFKVPLKEFEVSVVQLEPAWLYSLYLDGPGREVYLDEVNEDNKMQLAFPDEPEISELVLESKHYTIGVDRRQVTLLPLAARDFAFVAADLSAVATWPIGEQEALVAFMLGGGRLCLFNTAGATWRLPLAKGPRHVGRGWLIPVAGDFAAAREEMEDWLAGELTEFVLWAGGTSAGRGLGELLATESLKRQLRGQRASRGDDLISMLSGDGVLSHQPGFLHPIWIYRETCSLNAVEPWDYPEFTTAGQDLLANKNLLQVLRSTEKSKISLIPLAHLTKPARKFPPELLLLAMLIVGSPMFVYWPWRRRWTAMLLASLAIAASGWLWLSVQPQLAPPVRLVLTDGDVHSTVSVRRELVAGILSREGLRQLPIPGDAVLRHISWENPGAWRWDTSWLWDKERNGSVWRGEGQGQYIALATDSQSQGAPHWPVWVETERVGPERVRISVNTSGLAAEDQCYLLTPLGWRIIRGASGTFTQEISLPEMPLRPGRERLFAWEHLYETWNQGFQKTLVGAEYFALQQIIIRSVHSNETAGALEQLGLLALIQNPTMLRGLLHNQGMLIVPLGSGAEQSGAVTARFLRLTFSLE